MIRTDFLIRQITELIQALSALVLKRKTSAEETINPSLIDSGINLLRIKKERFFSLSAAGLIDVFSKQSFGSDKIELAAYLLLLDERNSKISHKHTARELLSYISQNSDTYSQDREELLKSLKEEE